MPDPPASLQTRCNIEGRVVTLDLPQKGFGMALLVALIGALVFPTIVTFVFLLPILKDSDMPRNVKFIFLGFIGVFFIIVAVLRHFRYRLAQGEEGRAYHRLA